MLEKLAEVEARLGQAVTFDQDDGLPGMASAQASPSGTVRLSPAAVQNASVIGEEIMHLHRWACGFPVIQPGAGAQLGGYARGLTQLAGHFDEFAFFQFIEGLGLNPRS